MYQGNPVGVRRNTGSSGFVFSENAVGDLDRIATDLVGIANLFAVQGVGRKRQPLKGNPIQNLLKEASLRKFNWLKESLHWASV